MKLIVIFLLHCIIAETLCVKSQTVQIENTIIKGDTAYKIVKSFGKTYGYEIYVKGHLFIRQENIPGLSGNRGFLQKADAGKTARLVIKKIENGLMPPTLTRQELDSLKILFP